MLPGAISEIGVEYVQIDIFGAPSKITRRSKKSESGTQPEYMYFIGTGTRTVGSRIYTPCKKQACLSCNPSFHVKRSWVCTAGSNRATASC
jgi:hypothetical protein